MPFTKKPKSAPRRKYARKPKAKMTFEKRVMNIVHKQAETKQKVINLFNNSNIQGSGLSSGNGVQVANILSSMSVAQGLEQEQRQGNEISNCKLRLRGLLESLPVSAETNPSYYNYEIHMVVFKKKDDPTNSNLFLKTAPGNITTTCDGTLINTMYPYNKDLYVIKRTRVFRMQPVSPENSSLAQPDTYIFRRFYVDIPISKKLKYNDSLTDPTNDWVSIGFYVVNADGTTQAGTSVVRAQLTMDAMLTYDDF